MVTSEKVLAAHQGLLKTYGFNADLFEKLQQKLKTGQFNPSVNLVTGPLTIPASTAFTPAPEEGSQNATDLHNKGQDAIDAGRVALVVLNGGMATRFGGKVKGAVDVIKDLSFLGLRLQVTQKLAPKVPIFLLNSFATNEKTKQHLEENAYFNCAAQKIIHLNQYISIRLKPDGEIFQTHDGQPSFYAPGHGDLFSVLGQSHDFQEFAKHEDRILMVVNVDNIFADLSPQMIGRHLEQAKALSVEIAPQHLGDRGGAPLEYQNKVQIIESFRLPEDFPHHEVKFFNTNTLIFNVHVFRKEYPLTWFRADKRIGSHNVVQFERLMGEITAFEDAAFLEVSRSEPNCRFWPIKTPNDLKDLENPLRLRYPWLKSLQ